MAEQNFLFRDAAVSVSATVSDGVERVVTLIGNHVYDDGIGGPPTLRENITVTVEEGTEKIIKLGSMYGQLLLNKEEEGYIHVFAHLVLPQMMFEGVVCMAQAYVSGMNEFSMAVELDLDQQELDEQWFTKVGPHAPGAQSKEMEIIGVNFFNRREGFPALQEIPATSFAINE